MAEKQYVVTFNMTVTAADGTPFMPAFGGTYHMPYSVMAATEHSLLETLMKLNEAGVAAKKAAAVA
jgi:hypothetical protein